jgi:Ni,Fe-hydrogenase I small subunit
MLPAGETLVERLEQRGVSRRRPTEGQGVQDVVPGASVVNLGGCPHNSANTVALLVHYLTFSEMPALDQFNRPLFAYGDLIHHQCERRAYFDAGDTPRLRRGPV